MESENLFFLGVVAKTAEGSEREKLKFVTKGWTLLAYSM